MSFASQGAEPFSPDRKLLIVLAVLGVATVIIADNLFRYGGVPLDPNPELTAERVRATTRPDYVKAKLEDNENVHQTDLASLQAAVGPHVQSRCSGAVRVEMRAAIVQYVRERAAVGRIAAQEPALTAITKAWQTPDDASALADAHSLVENGFLTPADFAEWPSNYDAVMRLPKSVRSSCDTSIADALVEERQLEQALQQRREFEARSPQRR